MSRRRRPVPMGSVPVKQPGAALLASFPPRPIASSWPATETSRSAVPARVLTTPFALDNPFSQQTRRLGVLAVLSWLQTFSGASWQQRWQASGTEDQLDWRDMITAVSAGRFRSNVAAGTRLPHLGPGLLVLICADVIRPSLGWLLRFAPARRGLASEMARTRDSAAFAALAESCTPGSGRVADWAAGTDPDRGHPRGQGRPDRRGPGRRLRRTAPDHRRSAGHVRGTRPQPAVLPTATHPRCPGPARPRRDRDVLRSLAAPSSPARPRPAAPDSLASHDPHNFKIVFSSEKPCVC